jgi:hypothetical protein
MLGGSVDLLVGRANAMDVMEMPDPETLKKDPKQPRGAVFIARTAARARVTK